LLLYSNTLGTTVALTPGIEILTTILIVLFLKFYTNKIHKIIVQQTTQCLQYEQTRMYILMYWLE